MPMLYFSIILKLVIGLAALVFVTRLLGKSRMSQVTPLDFVYALILGGTVEETIYHQDHTIPQMLFSIAIWSGLMFAVEKIVQKFDRLRAPLRGTSQILIRDGSVSIRELEKANLELEQLRGMLRQKDVFSLREVRYIFLETSGEISVLKYPDMPPVEEPSILLVNEGRVHKGNLRLIGKDRNWLEEGLKQEGVHRIEDIYYAEWSKPDGFFVKKFEHCLTAEEEAVAMSRTV
ncbi:Uncharacterized membrane protein YcaP, DUF421 family [Fictibacillus solisalsi]|uniref:Uncharacterized membrane protein YcaP, DUF421 family n=1 Tax=Fictibacillus solisalsi TaxID=459525 RepID=A0A1G9YQW2_9BACL|nr:DUF421 domain-containing protein [Fictibacillus solisalsi]SDN11558.1 Uncharacterized membrane protein YcaP, DUF421 family [Fictibacillus solisalsi]